MISDPEAFILANTRLQPVPHAPEISLWVADELTPIWRLTEEELGEMGVPPPFWAFAWAGVTLSPAVGAVLMSLSTIVVALNAQLLRRLDLKPGERSRVR